MLSWVVAYPGRVGARLKKFVSLVADGAMIAASIPAPSAIAAPRVNVAPANNPASLSSTINSFPNGGAPLKQAISDLIVKDPNFAAHVARELQNDDALSPAQKEALEAGLADGLNRLGIVAQTPGGAGGAGGLGGGLGGLSGTQLLIGGLLVGGLIGGGVLIANSNKSKCTPVSPNTTC